MEFEKLCHVCGGQEFIYSEVLWDELVSDWELAPIEIAYINRQQGLCCKKCGSNLRSIALAKGILDTYDYTGLFAQFVESPQASQLRVLEINEAGTLTPLLKKMPLHRIVRYPDFDMINLDLESDGYDLVVHSDTLEHVENPLYGLSECRRILAEKGRCIFTIPIVTDRLNKSRAGLPESYHGTVETCGSDLVVHTEFLKLVGQLLLSISTAT